MKRISDFIVKHRNAILLIATLLLIPSIVGYLNTRVNYDILSYLPADSESMKGQAVLDEDFNLAGTALIVTDDMEEKEVAALKDEIAAIPGVEKAVWRDDVLDLSIPADVLPAELHDALYADGSTMIIATFSEATGSDSTMDAIDQIKELCQDDAHIAGFSAITADTKYMVNAETPVYSAIAVLLCLVVLSLGLKSWLAPFIFLLGMVYPIIYNMGTNIFLGEISYITKALSMILLLAVSMDYSIFLLHRYQEEKTKQPTKEEAMSAAIQATFTSITSSSITTIAGFLALLVMQLTLGKDIGLVMAKGVVLAVICTILILPSLLMFFDPWIERWQHLVLIRPVKRIAHFDVRHPKAILLVFVCLFIPFVYFQANTNQYYDLTKSLPDSLPSVIGTNELKDKFDMTTTHFVMVSDQVSEKDMKQLISRIEDTDGVTGVISYEKFAGAGLPAEMEPEVAAEILHNGGRNLIVVNTSYHGATDEMNEQLDQIDSILKEYDPDALVTGEGALDRDLIRVTDVDFKMVNLVSIIAIFVIIALTFKSVSLPVLLVLAIEFAISVNMGIPYFTGSVLPFIAGIVIGTIQLGACIDYAILMTTRFKEELQSGKSPKKAMETAVNMTSPSIITSGLSFFAACSGVSMIAEMDLIKSLCILLGRGALISIVVILTVLPALLLTFNPLIAKTTKGWPKPGNKPEADLKPAFAGTVKEAEADTSFAENLEEAKSEENTIEKDLDEKKDPDKRS